MTSTLNRVATLLLAVAILLTGHGLQLTVLPVHAQLLGWSAQAIGLTGSAYFLGFVAGCFTVPRIVAAVGHIRAFTVMGALATAALLGAGLLGNVFAWLILRFVTGYALSGLYMVIESWLSEASPVNKRGTVLAIYTMISLLGMAVGQTFMAAASPQGLELFVVGALFLSLAIVPVGLTTAAAPQPVPAASFAPRVLLQASRVAVVCAFSGGMVTGALWAIGPLVAGGFGLDAAGVGLVMSVAILGGALAQIPVGRLSDSTDRRLVIGGILAVASGVALLGWRFAETAHLMLLITMFLLGATTLPIYALCVVHACDNARATLIEITSGILVMNSLGSIVGPLLVAILMDNFGPSSFFLYVFVVLLIPAGWTFYRVSAVERPREHDQHFMGVPRTTQAAAELLPAPAEAPPPIQTGDPPDER